MSIRDFDPMLKRAANRAAKAKKPKQGGAGQKFRSYNATPIAFGVGAKSYKASDISSAAELGRALQPFLKEIAQDFRNYTRGVEEFLPQDLRDALVPTMNLSQVYVPKDTGELAESAYLEVVPFRTGARVEMGYGRNNSPSYAIYVHEVPHAHADPTTHKFLQKALDEDYFNIVQRVTLAVKRRLQG